MTEGSDWQPISNRGGDDAGPRNTSLQISPFTRLARTHALGSAADGIVAVALAGSIFFSIDPSAARWRVALYLICTMAPFAVVTPLIGPAIDRLAGGRRYMLVGSLAIRALLAFLMISHIDSFLLFPEAFGILIMQKAYGVAKSAVVPALVPAEGALVDANSKLALTAALSGLSGGAVGLLFAKLGGPGWAAGIAVVVFILAALHATRVPAVAVATGPMDETERAELRSGSIIWAASVVAIMRGIVGFVSFLLAFELRGGGDGVNIDQPGAAIGAMTALGRGREVVFETPTEIWRFGLVIAAAGIGALIGAKAAPGLRKTIGEERMVFGALTLTLVVAAFAAWIGSALFSAVILALAVATSAAVAKLAFDSLVQRDAPAANYGRSFARFEARFQVSWVAGAFLPVVINLDARVGYIIIVAVGVLSALFYFFGARIALRDRLTTISKNLATRRKSDAVVFDDTDGATGRSQAAATDVIDVEGRALSPTDPTAVEGIPTERKAKRSSTSGTEQLAFDTQVQADPEPPPPPSPPKKATSWEDDGSPHVSSVDGVEFD